MTDAIHGISKSSPHGSPGPGWDTIAGGDGTQAVWLQAFPGSVELRVQPFPRRFRVLTAEYLMVFGSGCMGILAATYLLGEGMAELARYTLLWGIVAAISVFLLESLLRRVRGKKLLGRVLLSDTDVQIDIPTAPWGHNRFAQMPSEIRGISVCRPPWYRSAQLFDALFRIARYEVHIECTDGTRFIMSNLDHDAAKAIAAQLDLYANGVTEADS